MRNVAGEILGAQVAMKMAVEQGAESLTIVHDYQGIASWCTGEWKTNKEGTKAYKAYFDSLKDKLIIHFKRSKDIPEMSTMTLRMNWQKALFFSVCHCFFAEIQL